MYIPYDFLYQKINIKILKDFFYKKKIEQNCAYIEKNKKKVLKKIKNKEILKVLFYVYDCSKWKCDEIYKLMIKDSRFEPLIVVSKNSVTKQDNPSFQTKDEILKTCDFFKNKNYYFELAYDFTKNKHIPLKKYEPDIIIYQHPWYVETSQGPVVTSKFALSAYIPYDIPTTTQDLECNLRFHQYVQNYYVINEDLSNDYSKKMQNKGGNLKVYGAPSLDLIKENKGKYVIYAPHWSVNHDKTIGYSTFLKNGQFILDYAKNNTQFNWVFKPHPLFKKALIDNNFMNEIEIEDYFQEWGKIGEVCLDGNYYEIFNDSKLMITDCSTFLIEYLLTGNPLINIVSNKAVGFNLLAKEAIKHHYKPQNNQELKEKLDMLLKENNDYLAQDRLKYLSQFNKNVSENIIQDLIKQIYT